MRQGWQLVGRKAMCVATCRQQATLVRQPHAITAAPWLYRSRGRQISSRCRMNPRQAQKGVSSSGGSGGRQDHAWVLPVLLLIQLVCMLYAELLGRLYSCNMAVASLYPFVHMLMWIHPMWLSVPRVQSLCQCCRSIERCTALVQ